MSFRTIEVDGSGKDGMFVWWEPGQVLVSELTAALNVAKCPHLLPKSSTIPAALKETLAGFIESAKIKVRGNPVDINPLREDIRGFEAVRQDRGDTENFHDFVISVVLDEATSTVKVAKHNPQHLPTLDLVKDQVEERMTKVFHDRLDWYPTSMVSGCIARVISHLGGTLCRKTGGVYFLPESVASQFLPFADALDSTSGGLSICVTTFPLRAGERSYELVLKSIRKEISDALVEIEEGLRELGKNKQRSNGQATRLATLDALKEKVTKYEDLLGVTMKDMHEAVGKVKDAVAAHNVMEMCA
jgi:hypothetical protein